MRRRWLRGYEPRLSLGFDMGTGNLRVCPVEIERRFRLTQPQEIVGKDVMAIESIRSINLRFSQSCRSRNNVLSRELKRASSANGRIRRLSEHRRSPACAEEAQSWRPNVFDTLELGNEKLLARKRPWVHSLKCLPTRRRVQ